MARTPNLSTTVENERKFVHMIPGRLSLRPKGSKTVQLDTGGFATIETAPLFYETGGERRMSYTGRLLDPKIEEDAEILHEVERLLIQKPWMATDARYQIEIHGEFDAIEPWKGYDVQSADDSMRTYNALPDEARPKLAEMMKYELDRVEYDEELDEEISITNDDKVKMINDLYREAEKAAKADAEGVVDLT